MTKPSGGYPDFQSSAQWKGVNTFAPNTAYPVGTSELAFIDLTNWSSLGLQLHVTTGNILVTVAFYADQAKTVLVDTYNIPTVQGTTLDLLLPAVASFADISINTATGGGCNVRWNLTPTNVPTNELSFIGAPQVVGDYNNTLAASASKVSAPFYIAPGPAYLCFNPYDATGKLGVDIIIVDQNGNPTGRLVKLAAPTTPVMQPIIMPVASVQVTVTNNDGAAPHSYDLSLVANGG